MTDRIKDLEHIEPVAAARAIERFNAAAWPDETLTEIGSAAMAFSQAVSLKRIADALEVSAVTEATQRHYARALAVARSNRDHDRARAYAETAAALDAQQAADQPDADSEGWIPWHGGDCPVTDGTAIDFRMRDGEEIFSVDYPAQLDWSHCDTARGSRGEWEIVAYRIHKD